MDGFNVIGWGLTFLFGIIAMFAGIPVIYSMYKDLVINNNLSPKKALPIAVGTGILATMGLFFAAIIVGMIIY